MAYWFRAGMALPLLVFAHTATADPTFGAGLTLLSDGRIAVGLKVFSNDEHNEPALSIGLDYVLVSKVLRANIGIAYLHDEYYADANIGYDFDAEDINFGIMIGGLRDDAVIKGKTGVASPPTATSGGALSALGVF